jgi:hypothetical protein
MFIRPCLPTPSKRAPTGPEWVHEIKHDDYRLIVRRDGDSVRLYTRCGFNWKPGDAKDSGWVVLKSRNTRQDRPRPSPTAAHAILSSILRGEAV